MAPECSRTAVSGRAVRRRPSVTTACEQQSGRIRPRSPEDRDAHPDWKEEIHVSPAEREAFQALTALGLSDAFRLFPQADKSFSWWDYRMMAFRRNFGLRIDHILLSDPLAAACVSSTIDRDMRKLERPSDHAPVIADIKVQEG